MQCDLLAWTPMPIQLRPDRGARGEAGPMSPVCLTTENVKSSQLIYVMIRAKNNSYSSKTSTESCIVTITASLS